jgi:hypothetical protein
MRNGAATARCASTPLSHNSCCEARDRSVQSAIFFAHRLSGLVARHVQVTSVMQAMAANMEDLEEQYGSGKVNFVVLDAEKAENAK